MLSHFGHHELHFFAPATPTAEKLTELREFLANFKGQGCRFAFTAPAPGQRGHVLQVLAYAPGGRLLAELRALLPDELALNEEQAAALVGVWNAADVQTM